MRINTLAWYRYHERYHVPVSWTAARHTVAGSAVDETRDIL